MAGVDEKAFEISSLTFSWPGHRKAVLSIDHLELARGERLFLRGPSGSGKSTLLSALAGVIDIGVGQVRVSGRDIGQLKSSERDQFRGDKIGMIFQLFNLIPWLSPLENVLLPCRFSRSRRDRAGADPAATARRLLVELGLTDPALHVSPSISLSVGQQQRVAAARALIGAPDLILADEPTSALDDGAKGQFVDLLDRECAAVGAALLFVSHDRGLEAHFDRVIDIAWINTACPQC